MWVRERPVEINWNSLKKEQQGKQENEAKELEKDIQITVCGYKFNHLVANLTTSTAFTSASFRGQPRGLEERLRNKKCRQVTNLVPCF